MHRLSRLEEVLLLAAVVVEQQQATHYSLYCEQLEKCEK
jgi:hypothetical protein